MAAVLTQQQRTALLRVYRRQPDLNEPQPQVMYPGRTYMQFRRTAHYDHLMGCVMVPFCNMWLGIEPDGYTHS